MDILNPGNLNYWEQILKNKEDIESLKKNSNMFTYVVGHATSIDNMPFDSDNIEINKNDFRGYIINRVINDDNPNYTLNVTYNTHNYETDMFIFFGTEKGLYLICFPVYNNESILYLGKWNGITYEYCNQITQDLADSIQELTETLSNYQPKLNFDETPTLGSNNPVTSKGIYNYINNTLEWKFLGQVKGTNTISIAGIFDTSKEYKICISYTGATSFPTTSEIPNLSILITKPELTAISTTAINYFAGARYSGTYGVGASVKYLVPNKTFNIVDMYFNGDIDVDNMVLFIWYR